MRDWNTTVVIVAVPQFDSLLGDGSRSFLEDAEHLEAAELGKGSEPGDLAFTGLIGGRHPGVDGRGLSQLNPIGSTVGNRLIFLTRELSKTD